MATTHYRAIGNQNDMNCGVDPRAGISGNPKTRRHYPVAQQAQLCMRVFWKKSDDGKHETRCRNRRKCDQCLNFGNYKMEKRRITKDR